MCSVSMAVAKVFMPPIAEPSRMPHRMRSSFSRPPSAHATPAASSACRAAPQELKPCSGVGESGIAAWRDRDKSSEPLAKEVWNAHRSGKGSGKL